MTTRRRLTSRLTRSMLSRSRKRAGNAQVSQVAEVTDQSTIASLGITFGTATDGRLVMSKRDWARALAAGAVQIISVPTD